MSKEAKMGEVSFSREQTQRMAGKLQNYLRRELDVEIGDFDAEFLLEFIANELGGYYYNQGMTDALTVIEEKMESVTDALTWLQKLVD